MHKNNLQQNRKTQIKRHLKGRAWVKLRRTLLTMIAVAALAVPAAVMATEVDVPYEQDFTNDSAKASVADTFHYRLTADDSAPMPEGSSGGSYDFSLNGDTEGVLKLDIPFAKPGSYYYTIKSHETSPKKGYTYESKDYKVQFVIINGTSGLVQGGIAIWDADHKVETLLLEPSYYQRRPNPDPNPDPDPDPDPTPDPDNGGGGGAGAGAGAVAGAPADGTPAPAPQTTIDDPEPPLAGVKDGEDYWALINLIAMILTWITAILGLIFYIRRRNQASKLEDRNEEALKAAAAGGAPADLEEAEEPDKLKRKGIARVLTIVVAIISLILFILTEDMTLPMELIDEWTIWMIILLVIALVLALISRKVTAGPDDQQEPTPGA